MIVRSQNRTTQGSIGQQSDRGGLAEDRSPRNLNAHPEPATRHRAIWLQRFKRKSSFFGYGIPSVSDTGPVSVLRCAAGITAARDGRREHAARQLIRAWPPRSRCERETARLTPTPGDVRPHSPAADPARRRRALRSRARETPQNRSLPRNRAAFRANRCCPISRT